MITEEVNLIENQGCWFIDTSVTVHVCADMKHFSTYTLVKWRKLDMENQTSIEVVIVVEVVLKLLLGVELMLSDVLHVLDILKNMG